MHASARGFSLAEMAVVVAIVALLLAGLLLPLGTQIEQRNVSTTQAQLEAAREALLGFAIINGRLPCPAAPPPANPAATDGMESPVGGGACTNYLNGFLPAVTLGLQPVDSRQFAVDAWGNRIRYAVAQTAIASPGGICPTDSPTAVRTPAFTNPVATAPNLKLNGIACVPNNLIICSVATGSTPAACAANSTVTNQNVVVAVLLSTGKNGATGGTDTDELENLDNDGLFISHEPRPSSGAGGEFDDILVWLTAGTLYGRMIAAGALP